MRVDLGQVELVRIVRDGSMLYWPQFGGHFTVYTDYEAALASDPSQIGMLMRN